LQIENSCNLRVDCAGNIPKITGNAETGRFGVAS
jgi:hypothetical protein